ncbi:hypothetical protein [Bailinhaonella thermotolerans]|uniref:Uncharacterized protein n=1 Tax=Bailinhaonella thermotolerans TaxID=1070861 RepID=A0A3A4AJK3_9ACTN|nr:hypothetical protein [Bailinhaonella thermotolerans]RJL21051.1 hypothetical protein D5H75_38200 [Bailinhaonella thermotolerans]
MSQDAYRFAALDPRPVPEAREHNAAVIVQPALGIKVTAPQVAAACDLGTIGPEDQDEGTGTVAIESALTCPLPPAGTTLVTADPDAGSLGAMAVLALRAAKRPLDAGVLDRVRLIAAADAAAAAPWPGPQPTSTPEDLVGPATPVFHAAADPARSVAERVDLLADWLRGRPAAEEAMAGYRARALDEARTALADLRIRVHGPIAVVIGTSRAALTLGHRSAPMALHTDAGLPAAGGKLQHTLARWNRHTQSYLGWPELREDLNAADPVVTAAASWGGSASTLRSPHGVGSGLSTEDVLAIVREHLADGMEHRGYDLVLYAEYYAGMAERELPYDEDDATQVEEALRQLARDRAALRAWDDTARE